MALTQMPFEIYYEDGREQLVTSDQRDQVMYERKYAHGITEGLEKRTMQCFRFLGWAALRRTGQLEDGLKFEVWDATVIAVEPPDEDEVEELDPTQQGAPQLP